MKNIIKSLILFSFVLSLSSCETDKFYSISGFDPYVDDFKKHASTRGYDFNFKEKGLIIESDYFEGDTAAKCYYEDPIRIVVDKEIWINSNEDRKEAILFRQLALGFLNRQNKNVLFSNGEWNSLMRGIPIDQEAYSTINFSGFRKNYYLDELFHEKTKNPWWSDYSEDYNNETSLNYEIILEDDFLDNQNSSFNNEDTPLSSEISNGELTIYNDNTSIYKYLGKEFDFNTKNDFQLDFIIKCENAGNTEFSGIIIGGDGDYGHSNSSTNALFIGYNNQGDLILKDVKENFTFFKFPNQEDVNEHNYNKISVRKTNDQYSFFVNEMFVYITDIYDFYGKDIGFRIAENSTLIVDRISISEKTDD